MPQGIHRRCSASHPHRFLAIRMWATALAAATIVPSVTRATPKDDPLVVLRRVRERIASLEFTERRTIEDRSSDGTIRTGERVSRVFVDRRAGRTRWELLSVTPLPRAERSWSRSGTAKSRPDAGSVAVARTGTLEPAWLFGLRKCAGQEILLDATGLPVRVRAFGSRGEVLDEAAIRWQEVGSLRFPAEIMMVRRSRFNTLTTTVRYVSVRLNHPVAATLFSVP